MIKDLIAARLEQGGEIRFGVRDVALHKLDLTRPSVTFCAADVESVEEIYCEFMARRNMLLTLVDFKCVEAVDRQDVVVYNDVLNSLLRNSLER